MSDDIREQSEEPTSLPKPKVTIERSIAWFSLLFVFVAMGGSWYLFRGSYWGNLVERSFAEAWNLVLEKNWAGIAILAFSYFIEIWREHGWKRPFMNTEFKKLVSSLVVPATMLVGVFFIFLFGVTPHETLEESQKEAKNEHEANGNLQNEIGKLRAEYAATFPKPEGLNITYDKIPSPDPTAPYAIRALITAQSNITPFSLGFVCDKPLEKWYVAAPSPNGVALFSNLWQDEIKGELPKTSYRFFFDRPIVGPEQNVIVTLISKEPFRVISCTRLIGSRP
jgi:hypothetical protein